MAGCYIFDVEGTLIDCVPHTLKCWQETLTAAGVPVQPADLQRLSGMDGNDMLKTLAPHVGKHRREDLLKAQSERYRAVYLPRARAFDGVRSLFAAIKSGGGRIALATDCKDRELEHYRRLIDADDFIDVIACGDEVSKGKPDPALLELALDHLGGPEAAAAIMVGDTPFDAQAARQIGVTAWGMLGGSHARSSLFDAGCSVVVSSPADFRRHLAPRSRGVMPLAG